jgi:hypothetical protein
MAFISRRLSIATHSAHVYHIYLNFLSYFLFFFFSTRTVSSPIFKSRLLVQLLFSKIIFSKLVLSLARCYSPESQQTKLVQKSHTAKSKKKDYSENIMSSQIPQFLSRTALLIQELWKVLCTYRSTVTINAINVSADGKRVDVHTAPPDPHRSFIRHPSDEFPTIAPEIHAAIAAHGTCIESVTHMHQLLHRILTGTVDFASAEINQSHDVCVFDTVMHPSGTSVMNPSHDIIGLALSDGRSFAVDPSIAQYGFFHGPCVLPMAEYRRQMGTDAARQTIKPAGSCAAHLLSQESAFPGAFWLQYWEWHRCVQYSVEIYWEFYGETMRAAIFGGSEDVFREELERCLRLVGATMCGQMENMYSPAAKAQRASWDQVSFVVLFLCVVVVVFWFVSCRRRHGHGMAEV